VKLACSLIACLWFPLFLIGDPLIPPRGVVNSASFVPAGLPGGAIAQGSIFSIFGSGLGPNTPVQASTFPLSTTLAGVSVRVFQGATSVNAYPLFVAAWQLNVLMPSSAPLGRVSVQVAYNGVTGNPAPVTVVASSFGVFSVNGAGNGPGIVTNFVTPTDQPVNSLDRPATPGQVEILWGTGLGPLTTPDNVPPPAGWLPTPVEVFVGGIPAHVDYSGRSPCCSGLDQIVIKVPEDAPLGCYVPVMVRARGTTVSNSVTMAVTRDGSSCAGTLPPVAQALAAGGRAGLVSLSSWHLRADIEIAPVDLMMDAAVAAHHQGIANPFFYQPLLSTPPAGSCLTFTAPMDLTDFTQQSPLLAMPGAGLDAGSGGTISGTGGSLPLGLWRGSRSLGNLLGFGIPGVEASPYFGSGEYTLTAVGGADVGAVSVTVPYAAPVNWSNRDSKSTVTIDRSGLLTLSWTGTSAPVFILGGNVDVPTNSTGLFLCTAPAGASSFTVPVPVMQAVPPARFRSRQQKGFLFLGTAPAAGGASFSAQGLDVGGAFFLSLTGRTVMFK
jgi:uncharacterized protein (TIGR03437 family)